MSVNLRFFYLFLVISLFLSTSFSYAKVGRGVVSDPETVKILRSIQQANGDYSVAKEGELLTRKSYEQAMTVFASMFGLFKDDPAQSDSRPNETVKKRGKRKLVKNGQDRMFKRAVLKKGLGRIAGPVSGVVSAFRDDFVNNTLERAFHRQELHGKLSQRLASFYAYLRKEGHLSESDFSAFSTEELIKKMKIVDFIQQSAIYEELSPEELGVYSLAILHFVSSNVIHNQYGVHFKLDALDQKVISIGSDMDSIKSTLAEQTKILQNLPSKEDFAEGIAEEFKDMFTFVKNAKTVQDEEAYRNQLQKMEAEFAGALSLAESFLIITGHKKDAGEISYYGRYAVQAITSAAAFLGTSGASLADLGSFSSACVHLFSPRMPTDNQLIMYQIGEVRDLIEDVKREMNVRFNRIETKLIDMEFNLYFKLDKGFAKVIKNQHKIIDIVSETDYKTDLLLSIKVDEKVKSREDKLEEVFQFLNDKNSFLDELELKKMANYFYGLVVGNAANYPINSVLGIIPFGGGGQREGIALNPEKGEKFSVLKLGQYVRKHVPQNDASLLLDYAGIYPYLLQYMNIAFNTDIFPSDDKDGDDDEIKKEKKFKHFANPSLVLHSALIYDMIYRHALELRLKGVPLSRFTEEDYRNHKLVIIRHLTSMFKDVDTLRLQDGKQRNLLSILLDEYVAAYENLQKDLYAQVNSFFQETYFNKDEVLSKKRSDDVDDLNDYIENLKSNVVLSYCKRKTYFIHTAEDNGDPATNFIPEWAHTAFAGSGLSCLDMEELFKRKNEIVKGITRKISALNNRNNFLSEKVSVEKIRAEYPFYVLLKGSKKAFPSHVWGGDSPTVLLTADDVLRMLGPDMMKELEKLKTLEARGFGKLEGIFSTVGGVHTEAKNGFNAYCPDANSKIIISFFWNTIKRRESDPAPLELITFKVFMPQNRSVLPYGYTYLPSNPTRSNHQADGFDGARCAANFLMLDFSGVMDRSPVSDNARKVFSENIKSITELVGRFEKSTTTSLIEKINKTIAKHADVDGLLALISSLTHYGYYQNNYSNGPFVTAKTLLLSSYQLGQKIFKPLVWKSKKDGEMHTAQVFQLDDFTQGLGSRLTVQAQAIKVAANLMKSITRDSENTEREYYPVFKSFLENSGYASEMEIREKIDLYDFDRVRNQYAQEIEYLYQVRDEAINTWLPINKRIKK